MAEYRQKDCRRQKVFTAEDPCSGGKLIAMRLKHLAFTILSVLYASKYLGGYCKDLRHRKCAFSATDNISAGKLCLQTSFDRTPTF